MFAVFKGLMVREIAKLFLTGMTVTAAIILALFVIQEAFGDDLSPAWVFSPAGAVGLVAVGLVVSAIVSFFCGYWFSRGLVRDLDDLSFGVRMLADGNLHHRWRRWGSRETEELRIQLNRMVDKWQKQLVLLQNLAEEKEELASMAREAGVMSERQRLARELHDAVSQHLFALSMTAAATRRLLETRPEVVREKLAAIEEMAHKALGEMRALLMHLRPVELGEQPLEAAIQSVLDELEQKGLLHCEYEVSPDLGLNRSVESNLLRIFQEAVANTLRHAKASTLKVRLTADDEVVRLSIEDDGVGFDPLDGVDRKVSYGLATMRERAEECAGALNVVSVPGKGTRIDVKVPKLW